MKEQLISYETAKLAEEKGFDEITELNYISEGNPLWKVKSTVENFNELKHSDGENFFYSAPTQSLLQSWLREVHSIDVLVGKEGTGSDEQDYVYTIIYLPEEFKEAKKHVKHLLYIESFEDTIWFSSFEEAFEEGLFIALKLV